MGHRKTPETREEMQAEIDYTENKIRQLHNQETALTAAYSKEERRVRTRRLCTEAGILELCPSRFRGHKNAQKS